MSIKIMSKIWECGPDAQADCFVLLALADFANDAGECWPSIETVAKKVRMKERGVRQIIRRLEADGWLQTVVGGGRHGCNNYRINPAPHAPLLADKPGTTCPPAPHAPRHETTETRHETTQNPAPHAPEPSRTVNNHQQQPREASRQTDRERILAAIGADPSSGMIGPNGVRLGTMGDMAEAAKWSALGISTDDQCALISERVLKIRQKQPTFSPRSFGYFTGAMADFAAQKAAPIPQGYSQAKPDEAASKLARYNRRAGANQ